MCIGDLKFRNCSVVSLFLLLPLAGLLIVGCANDRKSKDSAGNGVHTRTDSKLPNVIYILADDAGYGDLGCYGQTKFNTPNIDSLAIHGLLFTNHYSGSTVCAPSRSVLFTGLHTGHTPIRGNKEARPEGQYPMPDTLSNLAKVFKKAGYTTGAFGKWGLGAPRTSGDPLNQGFDRFFGYNCQRFGHNYYPYHLWDDGDSLVIQENRGKKNGVFAPQMIHEQALNFIDENKDRPFFLFMPTIIPHAELVAPDSYMDKYRGKFGEETPYQGVDEGKNLRQGPYQSQSDPRAAFAAMMTLLDDQVGEVVKKIRDLGLAENTLIVFTSDNGPHLEGGADPDFFNSNGPLTGYKRDLYEGGIRVPMIAYWPETIEPAVTDHVSAFWDVLPTVAELIEQQIQTIDGLSFLPTLLGKEGQSEHTYLYWEFHEKGGRQALRKGNFKAVRYNVFKNPKASPELYDLSTDIAERRNIAEQHPEILMEMDSIMANARVPSDVFKFGDETYLVK